MNNEQLNQDQNIVAKAMADRIALARGGDAIAAVAAAMIIHSYPEISRRIHYHSEYDALLSQAFRSKDPEFLICVADELAKGKYINIVCKRVRSEN